MGEKGIADLEAVAEVRRVVALREGTLGAGHPDTLAATHELALSYEPSAPPLLVRYPDD